MDIGYRAADVGREIPMWISEPPSHQACSPLAVVTASRSHITALCLVRRFLLVLCWALCAPGSVKTAQAQSTTSVLTTIQSSSAAYDSSPPFCWLLLFLSLKDSPVPRHTSRRLSVPLRRRLGAMSTTLGFGASSPSRGHGQGPLTSPLCLQCLCRRRHRGLRRRHCDAPLRDGQDSVTSPPPISLSS